MLAVEHPAALVADFRQQFGVHPFDPSLPDDEAELLASALLDDPRSRCFAAVGGYPMPFDVWMETQAYGALLSALGVEVRHPTPEKRRPHVSAARRVEAQRYLEAHSVIAHLPEV